jgi:hypothetical protein
MPRSSEHEAFLNSLGNEAKLIVGPFCFLPPNSPHDGTSSTTQAQIRRKGYQRELKEKNFLFFLVGSRCTLLYRADKRKVNFRCNYQVHVIGEGE